jgi:hypothetical protein
VPIMIAVKGGRDANQGLRETGSRSKSSEFHFRQVYKRLGKEF